MPNTLVHQNNGLVVFELIEEIEIGNDLVEQDITYVIGEPILHPVEATPSSNNIVYLISPSGPDVPRCSICQGALDSSRSSPTYAYSDCGCVSPIFPTPVPRID